MEVFRRQDAERGVQVATVLEGFISRKVVKQTVMTVVYGVTRYGGRLQIEKRLRELSDFPQVCSFTPHPACSFPCWAIGCWAAGSSEGGACFPPLWGERGGGVVQRSKLSSWALRPWFLHLKNGGVDFRYLGQPCEITWPWAVE